MPCVDQRKGQQGGLLLAGACDDPVSGHEAQECLTASCPTQNVKTLKDSDFAAKCWLAKPVRGAACDRRPPET